jgi:16S rRNA processing protein RimM
VLRVVQAREQGDASWPPPGPARPQRRRGLKGARIFVSRASFPTPDDDEFYWVDLIGLAVVNREAWPWARWST